MITSIPVSQLYLMNESSYKLSGYLATLIADTQQVQLSACNSTQKQSSQEAKDDQRRNDIAIVDVTDEAFGYKILVAHMCITGLDVEGDLLVH